MFKIFKTIKNMLIEDSSLDDDFKTANEKASKMFDYNMPEYSED